MDLSSFRATGSNNPAKQVSVTKWNDLLNELELGASAVLRLSKHADATGADDIAEGLETAVAAASPVVIFATPLKCIAIDEGEFRIASTANLTGENVRLIGSGGTIVIDMGTTAGNAIKTDSGILELYGVEFDGGTGQPTNASTTTRAVLCGTGVANSVERVVIRDCKFKNLNAVGSTDKLTNLIVSHGAYLQGVTTAIIEGNSCDTVSGAAVFLKHIGDLRQSDNHWKGTGWYSTNAAEGVKGYIRGDKYECTDTAGIDKGGAINTVSDFGLVQNGPIHISGCSFSGYFSYGGIIRSQSDNGITIKDNIFGECQLGSLSTAGDQLTAIRVVTRGLLAPNATSSDPPDAVVITGNKALSGIKDGTVAAGSRPFIYVSNEWDEAAGDTRNPIHGVIIRDNFCRSPSATSYFTHGVIVHGLTGGIETVRVFDNDCELYLKSSSPVGGGIGFVATNSTGLVNDVQFGGNRVKNLQAAASSTQVCIQVGANVDNVRSVRPNTLIGGFYGIRTLSGAGPNLEFLDDQLFESCTTNSLFSQPLSRLGKPNVTQLTNANKTLNSGSQPTQYLNVAITAARTITLPAPGYSGRRFKIVRSANATGAFDLNINTSAAVLVKALTAASTWCEVQDDGTEYRLIANGTL